MPLSRHCDQDTTDSSLAALLSQALWPLSRRCDPVIAGSGIRTGYCLKLHAPEQALRLGSGLQSSACTPGLKLHAPEQALRRHRQRCTVTVTMGLKLHAPEQALRPPMTV